MIIICISNNYMGMGWVETKNVVFITIKVDKLNKTSQSLS